MQNNDVLAIIPARAGSKGLPGKNTIKFHGRPLITWTIDAAIKSECFSHIVVSSNDKEVLQIAREYGAKVEVIERPEELCGDEVPGVSVALHALTVKPGCKFGMFLQPTSPLRSIHDIQIACKLGIENNMDSLVSVTEAAKHPNWMFSFDQTTKALTPYEDKELLPIRQKFAKLYHLNGAIYFFNSDWLQQFKSMISNSTKGYLMPFERSIDIDTKYDLLIAEHLMSQS